MSHFPVENRLITTKPNKPKLQKQSMIEIENLSKEFSGFKAVDDITFSVKPGEVLGFLGPNGAGKSTTMKMLSGFITPTSGRIQVMGKSVTRRPVATKKHVGYLPEGAPLYVDMTPPDFLAFVARMRGVASRDRQSSIERVIQQLHLQSVAHKRIDELSKGFKRRVGIAQAILHDPDVLILDEPTDGLDPNQKHEVRKLIRNLSADKIVILSTHILEEVTAVCNRALVIANGRLQADDTPQGLQVRSRYHQAVTLVLDNPANPASCKEQLQCLSSVTAVESVTSDAGIHLTVFPEQSLTDKTQLQRDIAQLTKSGGWPVVSSFVETGRLEDVFRDITGGTHD